MVAIVPRHTPVALDIRCIGNLIGSINETKISTVESAAPNAGTKKNLIQKRIQFRIRYIRQGECSSREL